MSNNPTLPPIGTGRPKGVPNRATTDARRAIADFVDRNVDRLEGFLDTIAEGVPETKIENGIETTTGKWVRQPDPAAAYRCMMDVLEYHIPKLARSELTGKDGKDLIPTKIEIELVAASKGKDT